MDMTVGAVDLHRSRICIWVQLHWELLRLIYFTRLLLFKKKKCFFSFGHYVLYIHILGELFHYDKLTFLDLILIPNTFDFKLINMLTLEEWFAYILGS